MPEALGDDVATYAGLALGVTATHSQAGTKQGARDDFCPAVIARSFCQPPGKTDVPPVALMTHPFPPYGLGKVPVG